MSAVVATYSIIFRPLVSSSMLNRGIIYNNVSNVTVPVQARALYKNFRLIQCFAYENDRDTIGLYDILLSIHYIE